MPKRQPKKMFFWITLVMVVWASALLLWLGLSILHAYLIGISAATVLLYGYDKRQAVLGGGRVPEVILHLAALVGGTAGALLAQGLFRHKTRKFKFQATLAGIIVLQAAIAFGYWYFVLRTA